eukprot:3858648-Rhodomonas_salina.3
MLDQSQVSPRKHAGQSDTREVDVREHAVLADDRLAPASHTSRQRMHALLCTCLLYTSPSPRDRG